MLKQINFRWLAFATLIALALSLSATKVPYNLRTPREATSRPETELRDRAARNGKNAQSLNIWQRAVTRFGAMTDMCVLTSRMAFTCRRSGARSRCGIGGEESRGGATRRENS